MAVHKFAISIPEDVMKRIDRAAARRGVTRSRFISSVLAVAAAAHRDAEIAERVNRLFSDPEIREEQARTARDFGRSRTGAGWEW